MSGRPSLTTGRALVVPLSKIKLVLIGAGALLLIAAGYWMFSLDDAVIASHGLVRNPLVVHGAGAAGMVFFGLVFPAAIRKLLDPAPGLIVDDRGLTDNSSAFPGGFIPWSDITGFEEQRIQRQRTLYVLLKDPDRYIASRGAIARSLATMTGRFGPSPLAISSNALSIGFDELVTQLRSRHARHSPNS